MTATGHPDRPAGAVAGPSRPGRAALAFAIILLGASTAPAAADNTVSALEAAGWSERSPGLLTSLPRRTADFGDSRIGGDFVLAPGTALVWERRFRQSVGAGTVLEIELYCDGTNASSEDYRERRASFPVSITAVFGRDSLDLSARRRIIDFFAGLWYGFRPRGIRLAYAAGNVAPVGSMYRMSGEETVFILLGEEERGKRIAVRRDLVADFRAAYGRDPRSPVTRIIVRAGRPSRETGTIKAGVRLRFGEN